MRKFLALVLFASTALAYAGNDDIIATATMSGGATLYLTSGEECDAKGGRTALLNATSGQVLRGCWFLVDNGNKVQVQYKDGTEYMYDSANFTVRAAAPKPASRTY